MIATKIDYQGSRKGLNVFVEKPLCIKSSELNEIINCYQKVKINEDEKFNSKPILMVGLIVDSLH